MRIIIKSALKRIAGRRGLEPLFSWPIYGAAIFAAALAGLTTGADAGRALCGPHEAIVSMLEGVGEHLRGAGVIGKGQGMMQLWFRPAGATFSMVIVGTDGGACIVATGTDWTEAPEPQPGEPS